MILFSVFDEQPLRLTDPVRIVCRLHGLAAKTRTRPAHKFVVQNIVARAICRWIIGRGAKSLRVNSPVTKRKTDARSAIPRTSQHQCFAQRRRTLPDNHNRRPSRRSRHRHNTRACTMVVGRALLMALYNQRRYPRTTRYVVKPVPRRLTNNRAYTTPPPAAVAARHSATTTTPLQLLAR